MVGDIKIIEDRGYTSEIRNLYYHHQFLYGVKDYTKMIIKIKSIPKFDFSTKSN